MSKRYALGALAALLALAAGPARAQHGADALGAAVEAVKAHFLHEHARYGAAPADLAELAVADAYAGRRSGATYVYLRQAHRGVPVANSYAQAAVDRHGDVVAPHAALLTGIAARAASEHPALPIGAAADAAVEHLRRLDRPAPLRALSDGPSDAARPDRYGPEVFEPHPEHGRLVYFATEAGGVAGAGPLRLAWELTVDSRHGNLWRVRVDAHTGAVLDVASLTDHDTWHAPSAHAARAAHAPSYAPSYAPLAAEATALAAPAALAQGAPRGAARGGSSYLAFPYESPSHGAQTTLVDPHDTAASALGWHDDGAAAYTTTRGNNVYAYEDRNADNVPGFSPDGGAGLEFLFPFDPEEQPVDYQDVAVTNLFYWNNVFHDVMWHYGFDEPAGNFQADNLGNGGLGFDYVNAEAQDGSGTDNANFSTPPDGQRPRMQMYEWSPGSFTEVVTPAPIAGRYDTGTQVAGTTPPTPDWGDTDGYSVTSELVLVLDGSGLDLGCDEILNADEVEGKIALIRRGSCPFAQKTFIAQEAGAIGVVIHNCLTTDVGCETSTNTGETILNMTADPVAYPNATLVTIPAHFVVQSAGMAMRDHLPGVTVTIEEGLIFRDSDLDAGIIVHEYGHGVSNRLTGGPSQVGCLAGDEQMGEGWSDFYGLMLTQQPGDTAAQRRGIGTYVEFEPTNGIGIRAAPYSTDFAVNDYTYGDTRTLIAGQQHAVGHIWATALWEMTWELINAHGFDPDLYDAAGTAGNQVALQLVTEGMKLQPCFPGFVDGRDAILAANELLYDGAYYDEIWRAFARRGLGLNADQGLSSTNADNVEDFTLPSDVGAEGDASPLASSFRLSGAYPNPFSGRAQFTLEVGQAQAVRVAVYDALGRRVALLHDGALAAGVAHRFAVEASGLASGTYVVRVTGEAFAATERLTVLR